MAIPALLQAIGDILRPELKQDGPICLRESDPGSTCEPVTLHKTGPAVVLKVDSQRPQMCARPDCGFSFAVNDRFFPLFRIDQGGLTKLCDYIIFYSHQRAESEASPMYVFLCEMKSGSPSGSRKQIENGRILTDYIVQMARHHKVIRSDSEIRYRGLIFSPQFREPKGHLRAGRCAYEPYQDGMQDLGVIHYPAGKDYDLKQFCG